MKKVLRICLIAIMASLAIVFDLLKIQLTTSLRLTLYALPLLFAGCTFKWVDALLTGLLVGVLQQLSYGITVSTFFWLLAPISWCLVSLLCFNIFKRQNKVWVYLIVVIISSIASTLLNSLAMVIDAMFVGDSWYTLSQIVLDLPMRLVVMAIMILPYTFLLFILRKSVGKLYEDKINAN